MTSQQSLMLQASAAKKLGNQDKLFGDEHAMEERMWNCWEIPQFFLPFRFFILHKWEKFSTALKFSDLYLVLTISNCHKIEVYFD